MCVSWVPHLFLMHISCVSNVCLMCACSYCRMQSCPSPVIPWPMRSSRHLSSNNLINIKASQVLLSRNVNTRIVILALSPGKRAPQGTIPKKKSYRSPIIPRSMLSSRSHLEKKDENKKCYHVLLSIPWAVRSSKYHFSKFFNIVSGYGNVTGHWLSRISVQGSSADVSDSGGGGSAADWCTCVSNACLICV